MICYEFFFAHRGFVGINSIAIKFLMTKPIYTGRGVWKKLAKGTVPTEIKYINIICIFINQEVDRKK